MFSFLITLDDDTHFWVEACDWPEAVRKALEELKNVAFNGETIKSITYKM